MALEPTFEFPIALPHAREFERDSILDGDLRQSCALSAQMLRKPRPDVVGVAEVMTCLLVARSKVNQVDVSYIRAFLRRDERTRWETGKCVRRGLAIQLKDFVKRVI